MKESRWLWWLAVSAFVAGVSVSAVQAATGASAVGVDSLFTFPQVALLVAVAAAWGDMRTNRNRDREEFKEFRQDVHERLERMEGKHHDK
jgi:hypothetical protein